MNYNGNMPDWHQYNSTQSGISDVTSNAPNVNAGHLPFIPNISSTQLNSLNLPSDRLEKHHNDPNFNSRHFQTHLSNNVSHGHNANDNTTPLASMVQMQNCIGPYGSSSNTRNSLVDNLNGSMMDPRNTAIGNLNEELSYRNSNQVPFNGPITTHLNGPNMINMSSPHGSVRLRNVNTNSHAANRTGPPPSFVSCKAPCCNADSNIGYQQWEKYCSYQNNTTYRENIRPSGYQTADTRQFGSDFNFRKDNFDGKEILSSVVPNAPPNADHRRNLSDFKYRKDRFVPRNYPSSSSGMLQNYPIQNYGYTGEYQKYPYNIKEYSKTNNMNIPNQGMTKHQEQSFMPQQKCNNKQTVYQNNGIMSNNISSINVTSNMIPSTQNSYFNPQYPRNISTETSHDCQESQVTDNASMVNRMQTSTIHTPSQSRYQMYQQKIAVQRFSMENHLRELTRIPGYQSHPKYKECVLKYREILKLQQSVAYQGQIQQAPCISASSADTSIPPINLQFDQNGVLINSNYMPEAFPKIQQNLNPQLSINNSDKQNKQENNNIPEIVTQQNQKTQHVSQTHTSSYVTTLCSENLQKQEQYTLQKNLDHNQFDVQKASSENFNTTMSTVMNTTMSNTPVEQRISKEFADKPELDVRQFLANWDETDEDGLNSNLPNVILNNSTPVVVVGYENLNISTKTLENLEGTKLGDISSSVITFENQDKNNSDIISAPNCLTVSYPSTESTGIVKGMCKDIVKESIVQPGSIIQCISNGPDEIPTIHIVDNLEINGILQVSNEQVAETLERQDTTAAFFPQGIEVQTTSTATLETDKKTDDHGSNMKYNTENLNEKEYTVENSSSTTVESTSQLSQVNNEASALSACTENNLDSAQNSKLKKQTSFTSEESHNPDDNISLPDLPTSECTPISTTLNTPIHSDSEESSERVEDLTISTNPIEIIQNSPVISFTQSPTNGEPYDHLNDEENVKNKSTNTLEIQYQKEKHFKDADSNNTPACNTVHNTLEFSTDIDKNASTLITESNKDRSSPNKNSTSKNNEKVLSLNDKVKNQKATNMCTISEKYRINESQITVGRNKHMEKNTNPSKSTKPNTENLKNARYMKLTYHTKSDKKRLSQNRMDICSETIVRHNKCIKELTNEKLCDDSMKSNKQSRGDINQKKINKEKRKCLPTNTATNTEDKSYIAENVKQSDILQNEQTTIDNDIEESKKRMRLLKKYRKMKHKTSDNDKTQNKSIDDMQEISKGSKKDCFSSNSEQEPLQMETRCKSSEERERNNTMLKTFVTKNKDINSDFAIQVTNVNLKLKDKDHQKDLQHLKGEAENNGPLDAIKIEINVSCTERNKTEKLLHENIKNAVAETIGHLTSSISSGTKSTSTNQCKGNQCKNKMIYDKIDSPDYGEQSINDRSSPALTKVSICNDINDQDQSAIIVRKEAILDNEASTNLPITEKRKNSLSEGKLIDNIYEDNDTTSKIVVNTCAEAFRPDALTLQNDSNIRNGSAPSALKDSKLGHTIIRRRSVHEDPEMKIITPNICVNNKELKVSSKNSICSISTTNVQKKEYKEGVTTTYSHKNVKNSRDSTISRLNAIPSTSSSITNSDLDGINYGNSAYLDYNHFDIASNEKPNVDDKRIDKWKKPNREESIFSNLNLYGNASGYINPIFSNVDEVENLNTVPVYTTKDGKITYSPNPRFTYRELIMEAQAKESYSDKCGYFVRSPLSDYYDFSTLHKAFKRKNDNTIDKRKEMDFTNVKSHFTTKQTDFLSKKNVIHKSTHFERNRNIPPLDFFNNDVDKLYISKNSQKEANKNIIDLSFLEKQYNLDNKITCDIKQCKTEIFLDKLDYEKKCIENSIFDSNLFLGPKTTFYEETIESIDSYSSHIDRRNSNNFREFNFSEMFGAQKQLDSSLLSSAKQNTCDNNSDHKINDCSEMNESTLFHKTNSYADDVCLTPNNLLQNEQSNIIPNYKKEKDVDQNKISIINADNKSTNINNSLLHNEYTKKQESQHNITIEPKIMTFTQTTQAHSVNVMDEKTYVSEKIQCSTGDIENENITTQHVAKNIHVFVPLSEEQSKSHAESERNGKEVSDKNYAKATSSPKSHINPKKSLNKLKYAETKAKSDFVLNESGYETNDTVKDNSTYSLKNEIINEQVSSDLIHCEDRKEISPVMESQSIATYFKETNIENKTANKTDSIGYEQKNESIELKDLSDIAHINQLLHEDDNKEKLLKTVVNEAELQNSFQDQENDKANICSSFMQTTKETTILNVQSSGSKENECDLFMNETSKQNITEFTVVKNIIKSDRKELEELETKEHFKDCNGIIDTKLLCMDSSSDCGIYVADKCALIQMSEHEHFIEEDDSIVPMKWETSQIQEDAVNHLCSIDESSLEFAGTTNSLQSNSFLENLAIPSSSEVIKEFPIPETISETKVETNKQLLSAVESVIPVTYSESTVTVSNDRKKQPIQISDYNSEKIAYLHAADFNANTQQMVPKLIIKKTEANSKFVTKMISSSSSVTPISNITNRSVLTRSYSRPKIPKMIIRNARSRPNTPSIEAVLAEDSPQLDIPELKLSTVHNDITEELYGTDSVNSLQESISFKNKIPKMKIKLDEKHSSKIVRAKDNTELCITREEVKNVIPKMKIKNSLKEMNEVSNDSTCSSTIFQESKDLRKYKDKIPILKLRKQERNKSPSPEIIRKRQNSYQSEAPMKKSKKFERDEIEYVTECNSDSTQTILSECETKKNPLVCISEKIPKVIIKRTSASAEFKCELSKNCKNIITKSAKWQPEVKLERYQILDSMVRNLKFTISHISSPNMEEIFTNIKNSDCHRKEGNHKLFRSSSTSDLLPTKCKQRRMSDIDYKKAIGTLCNDLNFVPSETDSNNINNTCTISKKNMLSREDNKLFEEYQKDNEYISKSCNNNPQMKADVTSFDEKINQLTIKNSVLHRIPSQYNECKIDNLSINQKETTSEDALVSIKLDHIDIPTKHFNSTDFKAKLKELKQVSKTDDCYLQFPSFPYTNKTSSEKINLKINKEEENDNASLHDEDNNKIIKVKKKHFIKNLSDMDKNSILQDDIALLTDDPMIIPDNSEIDNNSVIKIESSDDSQTTIEILPASPLDDHNELENHIDGDNEQLYPADAIPTQFELELEITDNSNIDLLDVSMPKLNPITSYSSRCVTTEKYSSNEISKTRYSDKSVPSSNIKTLLGETKHLEINIRNDNKSVLENNLVNCIEKKISSTSKCEQSADFAIVRDNFCCNDSLIKEVLAAKETLKKCLSKSRNENNASRNLKRPKTVAEKKQSLSFDINNSFENLNSMNSLNQAARTIQIEKNSDSVIRKHNNSEHLCIKKKLKLKDMDDSTTISLKTFKQFSQTATSKTLSRSTNLSQKKNNSTDQCNVLRLQDLQQKEYNVSSTNAVPRISKSIDQKINIKNNVKEESTPKEDNIMPILEPATAVNFDRSSNSRDNSRSPPVITNQDSNDDLDIRESKQICDEIITSENEIEDIKNNTHKKSEMTITDFVTQLAYHEKVREKDYSSYFRLNINAYV